MVNERQNNITENGNGKAFNGSPAKAAEIKASTEYETCTEYISAFGGLLALVKFLDLVGFNEIFDYTYISPSRKPKLGHLFMVKGILMLLFIGFNRIWHFVYIRIEPMICGILKVKKLPAASTFWRYMDSLGINQANAFLKMGSILRERVWQQCGIEYSRIRINIDTTVETLFGDQEGGRKGHNTKNRGKKGYRPVLCFIDATREYLLGKLRKGETISGAETASFIMAVKSHLPGCVKEVLICTDGEFMGWESVSACFEEGYDFIIANKRCNPRFDPATWYRPWKKRADEYNSCIYQPMGWGRPCRFVAMRFLKDKKSPPGKPFQCLLFEDDRYTYRIFCTNLSGEPHKIIGEYDKRADIENLVGEAKREGLSAIPSAKFKNNYAYFQIVMLAYNIWRYLKMTANESIKGKDDDGKLAVETSAETGLSGIMNNTIRIARLKILLIAAKIVSHANRNKVKYSIHDSRTPGLMNFLEYLDKARERERIWEKQPIWPLRFHVAGVQEISCTGGN